MMMNGELTNNDKVWQTTELMKLENKGTSIIGWLLSVTISSSPFITGRRDCWTSDSGPRTESAVKPKSKGPTS